MIRPPFPPAARARGATLCVALTTLLALTPALLAAPPISLPGLENPVRVVRDAQNIPHVYAVTDNDAYFMQGYLHAQDRFFQMDFQRRQFSGRLSELVGAAGLEADVQLRTLGLDRAAQMSLEALPAGALPWLEAYAAGVNTYLANNPLPAEYAALELTHASVPPWQPVDTLVIGKGLAFGLSFDLQDLDNTIALGTFQFVGELAGFDGTALFFEDLYRTAPLDPTISIPGALNANAKAGVDLAQARQLRDLVDPRTVAMAGRYLEQARSNPALRKVLRQDGSDTGSNWWLVDGSLSESGYPMLANDPHLALNTPATFYEVHLMAFNNDRLRPLNANGVSFPGAPGLVQGCNRDLCWGSTVHPMDVTDVYQEVLVLDPTTGVPVATIFDGQPEPLQILPQAYGVNVIGDGVPDNLVDSGLGPTQGGLVFVVPRRNYGPIVNFDTTQDPALGISIQYTGFGPTTEFEAFRKWMRATNVEQYREGLQYFDVGSQNWAVSDVHGNIAYFTSAELPLREDLQTLNNVAGLPPYFVRDGTHTLPNEWLPGTAGGTQSLPYQILPFDEMPQLVNPDAGYILNANNDPVGTSLDNNPLNQLRPGGGLYYLSPGYSELRIGRIAERMDAALADGVVTLDEMKEIQANNQLLDAELLVPFILEAFGHATSAGAAPELAPLAADPAVAEAAMRLADWDFSTPTGIPQGYDPGDDPNDRQPPDQAEVEASIAATIYALWRSQMIQLVIDAPLEALGLGDVAPGSSLALRAMAHHLNSFDTASGIGASGIPFIDPTLASTPEASRDLVVLTALRNALDRLASDDFAPAFVNSTDLDDYRWGYLHRIVFDHPLGGPFSVPPAGGFDDVAPGLMPGIARSGGFSVVDASNHNARADDANGFMFGSGPNRRFVGTIQRNNIQGYQVIPGGEHGSLLSPDYAGQLGLWLTNDYHVMRLRSRDVVAGRVSAQQFVP